MSITKPPGLSHATTDEISRTAPSVGADASANLAVTDRLEMKLLAMAIQSLAASLREGLCGMPDRELVRRLAEEANDLIGEFLASRRGSDSSLS